MTKKLIVGLILILTLLAFGRASAWSLWGTLRTPCTTIQTMSISGDRVAVTCEEEPGVVRYSTL